MRNVGIDYIPVGRVKPRNNKPSLRRKIARFLYDAMWLVFEAIIKIDNFFQEEIVDDHVEDIQENSPKETTTSKIDYNYIGVLEIPSISLKRGLVSPDKIGRASCRERV